MKDKETKQLSVKEQMLAAEELGSKVAKIMNDARAKANKILAKSGHTVNIQVEFCKINDTKNEVVNG